MTGAVTGLRPIGSIGQIKAVKMKAVAINAAMIVAFAAASYAATILVLDIHLC
jgi:hypothetical protein